MANDFGLARATKAMRYYCCWCQHALRPQVFQSGASLSAWRALLSLSSTTRVHCGSNTIAYLPHYLHLKCCSVLCPEQTTRTSLLALRHLLTRSLQHFPWVAPNLRHGCQTVCTASHALLPYCLFGFHAMGVSTYHHRISFAISRRYIGINGTDVQPRRHPLRLEQR